VQILKANLETLNPFDPDTQLVFSCQQRVADLGVLKDPNASDLLTRLGYYLQAFQYPTVPLPGEDDPPDLVKVRADALEIANQLTGIISSR
jgi:hypothetical protein